METIEAQNLVGGAWEGRPTRERRNPARPGDVVSLASNADGTVVDRAIERALEAQREWASTPPPERGAILMNAAALVEERAETIARDLTREEGKTLTEATGEVQRAASVLRFSGSAGWRIGGQTLPSASRDVMIYTRREPLGVVAVITPWNFPIAIPAWKIAPALVAGNAVILKPASLTPGTATHLVGALVDAGMPDGVLSLLLGSGATIGDQLVDDQRVAAITFTGSVDIGARLYERAATRRARVQLEMGGKNALVVLNDADLAEAARIAAVAGFGLTGQACTATSRVICMRDVAPAFIDALAVEAARYVPADGLDEGALMGPVVSDDQLAIDRSFVDLAAHGGAQIVTGAKDADGLFLQPTIIARVDPNDRLAQEEIFGPVVSVVEVDDIDEAIAVVNGTRYGLTAGIVTADLGAVQRFVRHAHAGVVKVNQPTSGVELNVPFGGVGDSSTNTYREQGDQAIDFFTWTKSVYVSTPVWE